MAQTEEPVSKSEIERKRSQWARRQRDKHRRFFKLLQRFAGLSFHASNTFMGYLHGDVPEAEAESACAYECARESREMWQIAYSREKLFTKGWRTPDGTLQRLDYKEAARMAMRIAYLSASKGHYPPWAERFLFLKSFPRKDWLELSAEERQEFARPPRVAPLPMTDVLTLEDLGVFDKFKKMAEANKPVIEDVPPGKKGKPMPVVEPLLQSYRERPLYWALFNLDFSKTRNQLANEFAAWLDLPENQKRLGQWKKKKPTVDLTSKALDRLKDLAAWRLYRELDNNLKAANNFAQEHRKRFTAPQIRKSYKTRDLRKEYHPGDPRPFRDAKSKEGGKIRANEAALFGEEADASEAQRSAWEYLAEVMPQEFRPLSESMAEMFVRMTRFASKR